MTIDLPSSREEVNVGGKKQEIENATTFPSTEPTPTPTQKPTTLPTPTPVYKSPTPTPIISSTYSCDCSKTCTQITSCEEAYYQLNICGCNMRDGDDDGVPCENICPEG